IEALEGELRELTLRDEFAELAEALATPDFARTHSQRLTARAFMERGAEGVSARRLNAMERQYDELAGRIAAASAELAARKGRKPQALVTALDELKAQRAALAEDMEALIATLRRGDGDVQLEVIVADLAVATLYVSTASIPSYSMDNP